MQKPLIFIISIMLSSCIPSRSPAPQSGDGDVKPDRIEPRPTRTESKGDNDDKNRPDYINPYPDYNPPTRNPTPTATPDNSITGCYKVESFICEIELLMVELTNQKRGSRGSLQHSKEIAFVSREWSKLQGERFGMGHGSGSYSFGSGHRQRLYSQEFGNLPFRLSGENVAYSGRAGSTVQQIAAHFVDMWWNSSGHRQNMEGAHQYVGHGVYRNSRGHYYATQIFAAP